MKLKLHIALLLITVSVAYGTDNSNELVQYIDDNKIEEFRGKITELSLKGKLNLASPCDKYENTLLHFAVQKGHPKFVKELVKYMGTEIDNYVYLKNCDGLNPLQVAIDTWELALLKHLIKKKGNLNKENEQDKALLEHAAIIGDLECMKYLVEECGLDVSQIDSEGGTPLHYAASKGNLSCMQYLIKKIKEKGKKELLHHRGGKFENTPLHCLVASDELEDDLKALDQVVEELKDSKTLLNSKEQSPLDLALNKPRLDLALNKPRLDLALNKPRLDLALNKS